MQKQSEIKLFIVGIILVALVILIIWAIQNQKITPFAAIAKPASLSLSPSIGTYNVGESVKINIMIDAKGLQASGVEVTINYDPEAIEIIDQNSNEEGTQIEPSDLFPIIFENIVDPESKLIKISATIKDHGSEVLIDDPAILASIEFIPQKVTATFLTFDFKESKSNDSNIYTRYQSQEEQDVLFGILDGSYTFEN